MEERGPLAALDAGVVRIPSKDEASLPFRTRCPVVMYVPASGIDAGTAETRA